jgi:hypothetical protein
MRSLGTLLAFPDRYYAGIEGRRRKFEAFMRSRHEFEQVNPWIEVALVCGLMFLDVPQESGLFLAHFDALRSKNAVLTRPSSLSRYMPSRPVSNRVGACLHKSPMSDYNGLLTGRHGFFSCYEAFIHIIDSMFNQHAK